jgi:hypothetical protein
MNRFERFVWWLRYHHRQAGAGLIVGLVVIGALGGIAAAQFAQGGGTPAAVSVPALGPVPTVSPTTSTTTTLPPPPTTTVPKPTTTTVPAKHKQAKTAPAKPAPTKTTRPKTSPPTTVKHVTVPPATTTTVPATIQWYTAHAGDVSLVQAADANLWNRAAVQDVGHLGPMPQPDPTAAINQLKSALAAIQADLPSHSPADPAINAALTTLGQAAQDFAAWMSDPTLKGWEAATSALASGDKAFYAAFVDNGVSATHLQRPL